MEYRKPVPAEDMPRKSLDALLPKKLLAVPGVAKQPQGLPSGER